MVLSYLIFLYLSLVLGNFPSFLAPSNTELLDVRSAVASQQIMCDLSYGIDFVLRKNVGT